MSYTLTGTPSDQLPDVLGSGASDVSNIFVSMTKREPGGRDADYLQWHSLDHRPEQYRLRGIRHSLRLVSTPECHKARLINTPPYDAVDHVMTYFFSADAALDQFGVLSKALAGDRRPFRLPTVSAGYFDLSGKFASPVAIAGADVIPWRPALGVLLLVEENASDPQALLEQKGVAGIWWHRGGPPPLAGFPDTSGLSLTYCYLEDDPVAVTARLATALEKRWESGVKPLLAAPFYVPVPFEWDRYLP